MSSSPPGPYQSRILNFVIRQTQKIINQCDRAFRQIKVASLDGTQVLLYPLYVFLQTTRLTRHQLRQRLSSFLPQLNPSVKENPSESLEVDQPIQEVLSTVTEGTVMSETPTNFPQSAQVKIQGIASLISERRLVLISSENDIVDHLTPQQQERLHERIRGEITHYWTHRVFQKTQKIPLFEPLTQSPHPFPPVRFFWQLMAWVQTSPLALKVNLFAETSLLENEQTLIQEIQNLYEAEQSCSHPLLPSFVNDALTSLLMSSPPPTATNFPLKLRKWKGEILSENEFHPLTSLENHGEDRTQNAEVRDLRHLIEAAISYFFSQESLVQGSQFSLIADDEVTDPWLRETDLFFPPSSGENQSNSRLEIRERKFLPMGEENHRESVSTSLSSLSPFELLRKNYAGEVGESISVDQDGGLSSIVSREVEGWEEVESGGNLIFTGREGGLGDLYQKELEGLERVQVKGEIMTMGEKGEVQGLGKIENRKETGIGDINVIDLHQKELEGLERVQVKGEMMVRSERGIEDRGERISKGKERGLSDGEGKENLPPQVQGNWLEAKVTGMGYIKHPLEIFLEWLDRGMVWIEEHLLKIWQWWKEKVKPEKRSN